MKSFNCMHAATGTFVIAAIAASMLTACGGGGDDDAPPPGLPATVVDSHGDASKYLGTWNMGCAAASVNDLMQHSITQTLHITSLNGSTVTGTLTVQDYGRLIYDGQPARCTGSPQSTTQPENTTLTLQPPAVAATGATQGMADQVTMTRQGHAAQTYYAAFNTAYTKFWIKDSPSFPENWATFVKQ